MKSDENEQISNITYNTFLNQPEQVTLSDGRWIKYNYDGSGALIKTEYSTGEYWEFAGGLVYKNGAFYQITIPEGRAIYQGGNWQMEFDYKDHLRNTRVSFKADGTSLVNASKSDFDPWGVLLKTGQENSFTNRWEIQGKESEKTFGLNRINFGARTYNPTIGRFDKVDRYSEKYSSLSTYQYAANNPIRYIDINGDSLWIAHKGNNYLYNDGKLFNSDGSQFEGKMRGFLKQTFNALNQMNATETGSSMLGDLSSSTNNFYITHASNNPVRPGANEFVQFNRNAGYANAMKEEKQGNPISGGSGGMVYWNPNDGALQELGGAIRVRPTTNLGHELFHAFDANHGLLDNRPSQIGLERHEVRASYFENTLRSALKYPYREFYNKKTLGAVRLLDSKNQPINFPK